MVSETEPTVKFYQEAFSYGSGSFAHFDGERGYDTTAGDLYSVKYSVLYVDKYGREMRWIKRDEAQTYGDVSLTVAEYEAKVVASIRTATKSPFCGLARWFDNHYSITGDVIDVHSQLGDYLQNTPDVVYRWYKCNGQIQNGSLICGALHDEMQDTDAMVDWDNAIGVLLYVMEPNGFMLQMNVGTNHYPAFNVGKKLEELPAWDPQWCPHECSNEEGTAWSTNITASQAHVSVAIIIVAILLATAIMVAHIWLGSPGRKHAYNLVGDKMAESCVTRSSYGSVV